VIVVALAPDLNRASVEVDIADPQPAQLDPPQTEPLRQYQRQLIEQGISTRPDEQAEQRCFLDGTAPTARLGAYRLA
jgi:hypothetical protein